MSNTQAKGVTWDLSDLYSSLSDPRLESDLKLAEQKAAAFEKQYKPLFSSSATPNPSALENLLKDFKAIVDLMTKLGTFSHLSFAEKTDDAARGAFLQKIQTVLTDVQAHLLFFEVSWNKLDEKQVSEWMKNPNLDADRHFLEKTRSFAPYTLAEGEEKIMAIKSNTGSSAFSRLFDETMNSIPFFITTNGKREKKTEGEVLSLLHSPDRSVRKAASDSLTEGLKEHSRLLVYIFNMILADHRSSLKIRSYQHPMDARNLSNEIDLKSVMNLVESVKAAYPLAARYYRLKKKLLGLNELYDYDRYASLESTEEKISFEECKKIVLDGYQAFSPKTAEIASLFFEKRWIDAEVRPGKQGGGFCCATTPTLHPYILVNFTGTLRDVMTVAHELGHGIHQYLARKVGILESDAPLTMAETASVFGEMLIFEKILEKEKDPKKRLNLICGKIDDNFATVFRQIAMSDFEIMAHDAGLKEGELSEQALSDLWIKANGALYGDSVILTDNYRHGWKYIPHFIHSPFYVYAYAFAQLFVLCLYQKYKEDKAAFLPIYFEMLSLGGSKKPVEIARLAGIDLADAAIWKKGILLLETLVTEAEKLAVV